MEPTQRLGWRGFDHLQVIKAMSPDAEAVLVQRFTRERTIFPVNRFVAKRLRWDAWKVAGRKPREYFRSFYFGGAAGAADEMIGIDSDVYPENPSCPVWT